MAKVFEGGAFLDSRAVELKLSDGASYTVREIMPETMAKISKLETAEGSEQDSQAMQKVLAQICNVTPDKFNKIGMVEIKGAVDFLLASLFDMKPQT